MGALTAVQPLRAEPQGRHLDLVRDEPATRPRRWTPALVGGIAVGGVLALLFVLAVMHTAIAQGQAHLDDLDARASTRTAEAQELRLAVAQLESPERIITEAETRLGMVEPTTITYLETVDPSVAVPVDPATPVVPGPAPTEQAPAP